MFLDESFHCGHRVREVGGQLGEGQLADNLDQPKAAI